MTEMEHPDQAELSLQEAMDRMRAETPEMPESFRQGWRMAVREDAEKRHETAREQKPVRKKYNRRRRGFSIAAAAALVLGGTLLGRDAARLTQMPQATLAPQAAMQYMDADALKIGETALTAAPLAAKDAAASILGGETAKYAIDASTLTMAESEEEDAAEAYGEPAKMTISALEDTAETMDAAAEEEAVTVETAAPAARIEAVGASEQMATTAAMEVEAADTRDAGEQIESVETGKPPDSSETVRPARIIGIGLILLAVVLAALAYTFRNKKE